MEGEISKWTNLMSGWQKRILILKGDILYYYEKKGESAKGRVHLLVSQIIECQDDELKFEINTGSTIFYFKTETKEEKASWIQALKQAKLNADRSLIKPDPNKDFSFNSSETENLPSKLQELYSSVESMYNTNLKLEKELNIVENISADPVEFSNNIQRLKSLIIQQNESSVKTIKIMKLVSGSLKELTTSISSFNKLLGNKDCNFIVTGDKEIKEYKEDDLYEGQGSRISPTIVRSGINKNMLFNKPNDKFSDNETTEKIVKNNFTFYEADTDDALVETQKKELNKVEKIEKIKKESVSEYHNQTQTQDNSVSVKKSKFYDEVYDKTVKRTRLPNKRIDLNLNVWSILKDAIGKDLNKFCVPVYFNEPISMLQRLCENFQYSDLLNKAAQEKDQYKRMAYIAAFNIAGHALNPGRTLKSFNPLLMETYELVDTTLGFRYFAEQVSHHPAISACYVEGNGYFYYTNSNSKQNFLFTKGALEVTNVGRTFINLTTTGETFSFIRPKVIVKGLIVGKMSVEFFDFSNHTNHNTGDVLEVKFYGNNEPNSGDIGVVKGQVKDFMGVTKLEIEGSWLSHLDIKYNGVTERIWEKLNTDTYENYYFTDFASNMNYLTEELRKCLPPTDSRLRPDQRALEAHDYDLAAKEKHRLEEKQRKVRKENEKNKNYKHVPMYFTETYDDLTSDLIFVYNGKYWEDRAAKKFNHFPDIY